MSYPPSLCKLSHVELVTPDLPKSLWFFRDLIGMEEVASDGVRTYLRCWGELDHHSVTLREGPTGVDHIAFRASRPEDVAGFADLLGKEGVDVSAAFGDEAGHGEAIRFIAPHLGCRIEIVHDIEKPLAPPEIRSGLPSNSSRPYRVGCSPRRIDHVNTQTAPGSVGPADEWFRSALGFKSREWILPTDGILAATWMAVTALTHDLAIGTSRDGLSGRFHHVAFWMDNSSDVLRAADILAEEPSVKIDHGPSRHGVSQAFFFYFRDPGSGHCVEFFSGGYLTFDPDWEVVVWDETRRVKGVDWWAPEGDLRASTPGVPVDLMAAVGVDGSAA